MKNERLKMLFFVLFLGLFTSGVLMGMDVLTKERIEQNKEAKLMSSVLSGFSIPYNIVDINDIFYEKIEVITDTITFFDPYDQTNVTRDVTLYRYNETNEFAYVFSGGGVWGEITGVITLSSDFTTIRRITILSQQETPGLGGIIAERPYLNTYVGTVFRDAHPFIVIKIDADPTLDHEVDAITGGTRTSSSFEIIMNRHYAMYKTFFDQLSGGDDE